MDTTLAVGVGVGAADGGGATGGATGGAAVAHEDKPTASAIDTTIAETFLMGLITIQSRHLSAEKYPHTITGIALGRKGICARLEGFEPPTV